VRVSVSLLTDVVHQQDVEAVKAHTFEALLEGAHDAVVGIVEDGFVRRSVDKVISLPVPILVRHKSTPCLRGNEKTVAGLFTKKTAKAPLTEAEAIEWRRIEIAKSLTPRCMKQYARVFLRQRTVKIAQRRRSKTQGRKLPRGRAEHICQCHSSSSRVLYTLIHFMSKSKELVAPLRQGKKN